MTKLLCILHRSPPMHGAAQVGDFIADSEKLKSNFECKFITIKSSNTIADIGNISLKKIYYITELYFKIFIALLIFRPDKIYFTASVRGVAFYRDLLLSSLWKGYQSLKKIDVYYHYHTKGINEFVSSSNINLKLTDFFLKGVNVILLSDILQDDFKQVTTIRNFFYLPNGVENNFGDIEFNDFINSKYDKNKKLNILYLSNMIKSKGYFKVLELAKNVNNKSMHFNFAGGWQNNSDEDEFYNFINKNHLEDTVTYHGFVGGEEKQKLLQQASFFIFPTRYKNEAFPLSILEALSYGVPVIATDEASIPYILDNKSGIVITDTDTDTDNLLEAIKLATVGLLNKETSIYCRERYLKLFSLEQFEINLVEVLK